MNKAETPQNGNEKYKILFESIVDAILVTDLNSRIVDANKAAEKLTGYSKSELLSMNSIDFYPLDNLGAILDFIRESQNEEKFVDIRIITKDKEKKSIAVSSSHVTIEGKPYFLNVLRDMTHEKEVDRVKTDFISIASHQLRTPLTGIKWYCELLLRNWVGSLSNDQVNYINQIYDSNNRMIGLINDLLNVSRMEAGGKYELHLKEESCSSVIADVLKEQEVPASSRNIKISLDLECPQGTILRMDREKIFQALQNMLDNAIKYSPSNSTITVGCEIADDQIVIHVTDQGFGIPENQQHRVFEKFFRADNAIITGSGTGLGLFIAKFIVDAHNGKIWFTSKEGQGTTFYISLPLAR